jgi:hypothetical protein
LRPVHLNRRHEFVRLFDENVLHASTLTIEGRRRNQRTMLRRLSC